jgi:heme exporter protein C
VTTHPVGTGSKGTRILGVVTLAGIALGAFLALVTSPPDASMGNVVRLLYLHVPVVTDAYVGCGVCALGSAMYLWKRSAWWDVTAEAAGELALVFTALTLVTGMIWGKPAWGAYWVWDARLTSTAMLGLMLLGYAAMRRLPTEPGSRSFRSAVLGVLLLPTIYIVNRSVTWWRSLHQGSTIGLSPKIHDQMFFTLMLCMGVGLLLFAWMLIHRWRMSWLERELEETELDEAIAARRAEAGVAPATGATAVAALGGPRLLAADPIPGAWGYVAAGWGIAAVALVTYSVWIIARGRALSRRVAPERRRWM